MEEIKNKCEQTPKDECMSEEDILNDILLSEKSISNNYSVAINEMSNKYLYKEVMNIFEDTKSIAREIYNFMFSKGWYSVTQEDEKNIEKSFTKYSKKLSELS